MNARSGVVIAILAIATAILAITLGAVQIASMSAYGDLATKPSLPAFLNASKAVRGRGSAGGAFEQAEAFAHDKNFSQAARLLATIPEDRRTDDLHGDIARSRGDSAGAFDWYLRAGDALRAQAIVDSAFDDDPQRALAAQLRLVRTLERGGATGDLLADAWWKLGERQRAASDASGGRGSREALGSFERALAEAPNRKSYLLAAGIEALKLGDDDAAARLLAHAIEVGPSNANGYGALALAYAAQKNCGPARTALDGWRARATANARPPEQDPQFGAPLRACLASTTAANRVTPLPVPSGSPAANPGPQIFSVVVSPLSVQSYARVSGTVKTSPDVESVSVGVSGVPPIDVPRVGPGDFGGSVTLPFLPSYVHGVYAVTFTAHGAAGRTASAVVGVTVP
jgi:tetratricopeptide (TPR) repeat protein